MSDDYAKDTSTEGRVTVGGSATGVIETGNDFDWFAVELVAGTTYVIDLEGADSGGGTLDSTVLRGLYDSEGNRIDGTQTDGGGVGDDARLYFMAMESGTYYIAARGHGNATGDYTVRIAETVSDDTPAGARDVGDITNLDGPRFPKASLDGSSDSVDYFRFTLTEAKKVGLGLRQQDANADLFLEDAAGNVISSSSEAGAANERISETLLAGTYYVRVEAQAAGANDFLLRYGVGDPDQARVTELEAAREEEASPDPVVQPQQASNQVPVFASGGYRFPLAENADGRTTGVALGAVEATDPEGGTVSYSIVGGNGDGLFAIDASTGALSYVGAGEDHESGTASHELTVRVSDDELHSEVTVTVEVTDVNEAPAFGQASYAFALAENADGSTNGVALGAVAATDPEGGTVSYSIVGGNGDGLFAIDASTGVLSYVGAGEDHESGTTSYELSVRASDDGLHSDVTVTVNVTDVNEAPAFRQASYAFDLAENADGSTERVALGEVAATDPEGGTVTYSIAAGNGDGLFAIDASTGALSYVGAGEDHESGTTSYELTVRASDDDLDSDVSVTVNVTDVEEQSAAEDSVSEPVTSVSEPDGGDLPADTSTTGRLVAGQTVTGEIATSGDRDWFVVELEAGHTYIIDLRGGPTKDGTLSDPYLRGIHDADGNLIKNTANDDGGEGYNSRLTFTATESGTHYVAAGAFGSSTGSYELEVTDTTPVADGEAPAFTQASYTFDLAENADGSTVRVALGAVEARDPEDGRVTYSIEAGNDAGLFEIDTSTGALSYRGAGEDYESETNSYELTVRASDGKLYADVTVTVNVTNVEEPLLSVSEPEDGDLPADISTTGRVVVGETVAGEIEIGTRIGARIDRDWFAVELKAGKIYTFDLRGSETEDGTLYDPYLRGIFDSEGNLISNTTDDDGGEGRNSRLTFTATESGTHYVAAGAFGSNITGTYELEVTEIEDDFAASTETTGTVEIGGTATGAIEYAEDRDWFAVELGAGKTYTVDLRGSDTRDGTLYAPYLRGIHDANGNLISGTAIDNGGTTVHGGDGRNSRLTFTAAEGGTYYIAAGAKFGVGTYEIEVWEDDFASSTETTGTVEVGGSATGNVETGGDNDWFAVELEAGKVYQIDVHGELNNGGTLRYTYLHGVYDADGERLSWVYDAVRIGATWFNGEQVFAGEDSQAFFTPKEDGTYYVAARGWGSTQTGTYTVRVSEIEDDFPATVGTTSTVEVGGTATGELQYETDRDWFAVELAAGETYKIELLGSRSKAGTLQDPYIRGIHDADGRLIADTTDYASGPNSNSQVYFTPEEGGTYYVAAGSFVSGLRDEDVGTYTLQVSIDDFRDDTGTTGTVAVGGSVTGEIEAQADRDWFAVALEAGKTYQIDMEGSETDAGTLENPLLYYMRDADGEYLRDDNGWRIHGTADQDDGEGPNARVTFTPDEDGTYYVVAGSGGHQHAADSHGRSLGTYTLSVEELVDAI